MPWWSVQVLKMTLMKLVKMGERVNMAETVLMLFSCSDPEPPPQCSPLVQSWLCMTGWEELELVARTLEVSISGRQRSSEEDPEETWLARLTLSWSVVSGLSSSTWVSCFWRGPWYSVWLAVDHLRLECLLCTSQTLTDHHSINTPLSLLRGQHHRSVLASHWSVAQQCSSLIGWALRAHPTDTCVSTLIFVLSRWCWLVSVIVSLL